MKHTNIRLIFEHPTDYLDTQVVVCGWVKHQEIRNK